MDQTAAALRGRAQDVSVLTSSRGWRPVEALLRRRGFSGPLTPLPLTLLELLSGGYDLAHAFSPLDACPALTWRRLTGKPVVFSWVQPIDRRELADRRLRLRMVEGALGSDAIVVPDEETRAAVWRWLAVEPQVIAPGDGEALERLYRRLLR